MHNSLKHTAQSLEQLYQYMTEKGEKIKITQVLQLQVQVQLFQNLTHSD